MTRPPLSDAWCREGPAVADLQHALQTERLCGRAGASYVSDTMSNITDNTNTPFPDVPWSDWQIDARELQIVQRSDGKDWLLGGGAFGQVLRRCRAADADIEQSVLPLACFL